MLALVSTSSVVSVPATPLVRSVAVTWKTAELAVDTAASCFVELDRIDESDGQTDWRLPTMLSAVFAPIVSAELAPDAVDDDALEELDETLDDDTGGVTTMVSVPRGTVGTVTLLPTPADCPAATD